MNHVAVLILCTAAVGASLDVPWEKEPASVMGMTLGAPPPTTIPDCAGDWHAATSLCIYGRSNPKANATLLDLAGLPFPGLNVRGQVIVFEGKVAVIKLYVSHDDYSRLKDVLIGQYGHPTMTEGGAARPGTEKLIWGGRESSLSYSESSDQPRLSVAAFFDNTLMSQFWGFRDW
jgi:hypothetical protein